MKRRPIVCQSPGNRFLARSSQLLAIASRNRRQEADTREDPAVSGKCKRVRQECIAIEESHAPLAAGIEPAAIAIAVIDDHRLDHEITIAGNRLEQRRAERANALANRGRAFGEYHQRTLPGDPAFHQPGLNAGLGAAIALHEHAPEFAGEVADDRPVRQFRFGDEACFEDPAQHRNVDPRHVVGGMDRAGGRMAENFDTDPEAGQQCPPGQPLHLAAQRRAAWQGVPQGNQAEHKAERGGSADLPEQSDGSSAEARGGS